MRVVEYLQFRGGLKGIHGRKRRERVEFVVERCWLGDVRRQLIGTLSKGYRQRVGLADALLADPPVLILDEPTAGLDPAQIRETRKLIRELGQQHTMLLSTHILPEVEMTCDGVIIIHHGRVVASDTLENLANKPGRRTVVIVDSEQPIDTEPIRDMAGVLKLESGSTPKGTRLRITVEGTDDRAARLCQLAADRGWKVREVRPQRQTLEDLFVRLTGEEQPEEAAA
jgi:ABC-2 type transport system ATP-binding protein